MQIFETQRKRYIINELKDWALTIVSSLALLIVLMAFNSISQGSLLTGVCFVSIIHLSNTIVQYHVKEVRILPENQQVAFVLSSIMSGKEARIYDADQVHSEITKSSSFTSLFGYRTTLRIHLPRNRQFRITNKYGFSEKTLADIDAALRKAEVN